MMPTNKPNDRDVNVDDLPDPDEPGIAADERRRRQEARDQAEQNQGRTS